MADIDLIAYLYPFGENAYGLKNTENVIKESSRYVPPQLSPPIKDQAKDLYGRRT